MEVLGHRSKLQGFYFSALSIGLSRAILSFADANQRFLGGHKGNDQKCRLEINSTKVNRNTTCCISCIIVEDKIQ
jgi:hypothetical protein